MKKVYLSILFSFVAMAVCQAQNNTSPYSLVGIGDIESSYFDRSTGMANSGVSLSSNRFLYQINPASYSFLDDRFFHIELSSRFKGVGYSGQPINLAYNQSTDLQFKKIAAAIKIKPRWGLSVGLLPFSSSNYSFYAPKPISGTSYTTNAYYEGSGGANLIYIANSYKVSDNFSVGLQSSFLFGQLQQKETIQPGLIDSTLITTKNTYLSNLHFKLGLQYKKKINKNWNIGIGATGSVQTKIRAMYSLKVQDGNTTIYNNYAYGNYFITLPYTYTGGVSATLKDKYTFVTDYNYQSWSNLNYSGAGYSLVNSSRYSAGFEYSRKINLRNYLFERYFFQSGLYYSNSYLVMNGHQLKDMGATIGFGFNFLNGLGMQTDLQGGTRGTISYGLIKENYVQITLTFSYRDPWYTKVRRYD